MATHKVIVSTWPVFAGIIFLILGNGLQGTLLGIRGSLIGFSPATIGAVLATYYIGYSFGCIVTPRLIKNVGHIRVYAALASLASSAVLVYTVTDSAVMWTILRIITGVSFAAIFIVSESWLNASSTIYNRGKILSTYMICVFVAQTGGQLFLNLGDPRNFELFIVVSVLISLALVPISLSRREAPSYQTPKKIEFRPLFRKAPLGFFGCFMSGFTGTTFLLLAPVYAVGEGMNESAIAFFMAVLVAAGMIFQLPIGWISDKIDRLKVLAVVLIGGFIFGLIAGLATLEILPNYFFLPSAFCLSGSMLTIYSISASLVNDSLDESEIINASATLILINGAGSFIGPITVGFAMTLFGKAAFPLVPAFACLVTCAITIARSHLGDTIKRKDRSEYIPLPDKLSYVAASMAGEYAMEEEHPQEEAENK